MRLQALIEAIMYDVASSNIDSIGWENDVLEVKFKSGGIYEYDNVPESEFEDFLNASSKGRYFLHHIKNAYNYRKIN